jgi:hypothetical protein
MLANEAQPVVHVLFEIAVRIAFEQVVGSMTSG